MPPTIDLGYRPRAWQRAVHRGRKRWSILVVHRRAGKTVLAVMQLLHAALNTTQSDARFAYIAPYLKQAKAIAWTYLKRHARKIPGATVNESELWIQLASGAQIRIHGADDPDSLRGIYLDGAVLDEVAQMRPDTWGEVIRPALADRTGWALFLGTPKGANLFSELYHRAVADPAWFAARYTYLDTGALPAAEIADMRSQMSEAQFAQELLCDFAAASEHALIALHLVDAARTRVLHAAAYAHAPVILGVDVARYGDDRTVILRRQGLASFEPVVLRGADAMQVAARVLQEMDLHRPDAVFVDGSGGYGAGVIDRCRQLGRRVQEVQFGGKPNDARYANKRTEMWFLMAEWLKTGRLCDRPEWAVELAAPQYTYANAAGRLALESKDALKARGLPSPDLGDALALTFAAPVGPRRHAEPAGQQSGPAVSGAFDPFA